MARHFPLLLALAVTGCGYEPDTTDGGVCSLWSNARMLGTAQSDEILDALVDHEGNLYLAGYEQGITGTTNIEPAGDAVGIILKFSPKGELLAKQVIDTSGADTVEALVLHPDTGELHFVGRTNGALPGFENQGQFDLFIGRSATEVWEPRLAQIGTDRPEHPRRIALGVADGLVVAGFDDIFVPSNYVEAWENPLLTKYAGDGENFTEVWRVRFDTEYSDTLDGLAVARDTDGAIYVTGRVEAGLERGISVTKYDTHGSELWSRRYTGVGYDAGAALHLLPDGDLLLAGSTFETLGEAAFGQQDVFVMKLTGDTGESLWAVQYGSAESDYVTDMAVDDRGQIYLVGETLGAMAAGQANQGGIDAFLVKLASEGEMVMAKQWGSAGLDAPTAVAVDGCERAFVVGYTTGDLAGPSNGGRDGFVIPVDTRE